MMKDTKNFTTTRASNGSTSSLIVLINIYVGQYTLQTYDSQWYHNRVLNSDAGCSSYVDFTVDCK